jgi:hypothetical protein
LGVCGGSPIPSSGETWSVLAAAHEYPLLGKEYNHLLQLGYPQGAAASTDHVSPDEGIVVVRAYWPALEYPIGIITTQCWPNTIRIVFGGCRKSGTTIAYC